jgi:mono/diheme cytochrome c family protein
MVNENRGIVAGLAVSLGGGAVVIGLLTAMFMAASGNDRTVTVTAPGVTVAAPAPPAGTTSVPASIPAAVVSGAYDYVHFACGSCHGWKGEGGIDPAIPALTGAGKEFTAVQLRDIINKGAGISTDPKAPFMPVWGSVVTDQQVGELIAYITAGLPAVPGAQPLTVPDGAAPDAAGAVLYQTYGCINCHGSNGFGGVPDPAAPEKAIPPLTGADFKKEFPADAIAAMIKSGSVIGKQPITAMPHWGGVLSDQQISQLVAYIQSLK